MRAAGEIGSSLQAWVGLGLPPADLSLLSEERWAELLIVSMVDVLPIEEFQSDSETKQMPNRWANIAALLGEPDQPKAGAIKAPGTKCVRCWRVLPEVGQQANHPTLCARCADAVDSGLVCRATE
jgi:isoleucyl-tRNA synthetase